MNKTILNIILYITILIPLPSYAFTVYPERNISDMNIGRPTSVKFLIDTDGQEINTLEGSISIPLDLEISNIDTGGSIFSLWPEKPTFNKVNNEILFTGGSQGGFYGKDLRIFNVTITPKNIGDFDLSSGNLSAYLNDGNGTKINGKLSNFDFKVISDTTNDNVDIVKDNNPPNNLIVEIGKDSSLFNNRYFITFNASDSLSGVNRYEIKEGNSSFEKYENNYVIKDQSLNTKIWIKVIDNNGNEFIEKIKPIDLLNDKYDSKKDNVIFWVITAIVLLFVFFLIFIFIKKFINKGRLKKIFNKNE